jgi:hypothetical protein
MAKQNGYRRASQKWNAASRVEAKIARAILRIPSTGRIGDGIRAAAALILNSDLDNGFEARELLWEIAVRDGFTPPADLVRKFRRKGNTHHSEVGAKGGAVMTDAPGNNVVPFVKQGGQHGEDRGDMFSYWQREHPAFIKLPFVAPRDNGEGGSNVNFWNVQPSGDTSSDDHRDYLRGKQYADLTINAICADGTSVSGRALALIFEDIVADAISRRKKGGKGSRTNILSVEAGFISGLSEFIPRAVATLHHLYQNKR